jgi:hypothetical protein
MNRPEQIRGLQALIIPYGVKDHFLVLFMELARQGDGDISDVNTPLISAPNHRIFGGVRVQLKVAEIFVQGTCCLFQNILIK